MSGFYDKEATAQAFIDTLEELGQDITFLDIDGEQVHCKLSTDTAMRSNSTLAIKEFAFNGVMTFPDRLSIETYRGQYFKKDNTPNKTYMLVSTSENSISDNFAAVYYVECNEKLSIGYIGTTIDNNFNEVTSFVPTYSDILAFVSNDIRTQADVSIGTLPKKVTTILIPADYRIASKDIVTKPEFARTGNVDPQYGIVDKKYEVESVDGSLVGTLDGITYYGVFRAELTEYI